MRILGKNSCYNFDNEKLFNKSKYSASYVGVDERTNQRVFIKKLIYDIEEIKNISQINIQYPLIESLDIIIDGDLAYIIYPFIEGRSLKTIIHNRVKLSLEDKKNIIINSLKALEKLHEKGIIHGDIHPGNILVNGDKIYFADNGSIFLAGNKTPEKAFNLLYAAPEQILKQNDLWSFKTDWFSWGMSMYHFINKDHPFTHSNPNFTIQMMLNLGLEPLAKNYGELSNLIGQICLKPKFKTSPSRMSQSEIHLIIQENINERKTGSELLKDFEKLFFKKSFWNLFF